MPDCEFMESEHVGDGDLIDNNRKQLRPLISTSANQQAAIRATHDGGVRRICQAGLLEMFGGGDEIVEDVLLLLLDTHMMPVLAKLTTTSQVCDTEHAVQIIKQN